MNSLKNKNQTLTVRISADVKEKLIEMSNDKICHVSDLVRLSISKLISKE